MKFYLESIKNVLLQFKTTDVGLSSTEAQKRLEENGKNKLVEGKRTSLFKRFLIQLADPMIIILLVAAAVSTAIAVIEDETFTDVFIILFVVILNSVLGVVQESKAEKAIDALKEMTASTSKVLRDGELIIIKSEDLVVGDIIILEAGDAIPADARIIESSSLKCEEAALTGESVPSEKHPDILKADIKSGDVTLGDRANMVYMGSTVVYGRGKAVVCAVSMKTEMGKIANALQNVMEEQTPLQKKLSQLSKMLTFLVLGICVVIFAVGIFRAGEITFEHTLYSFIVAVSLAVAAIPEGLVAVVTIVLSIGVSKMSKRNAVIRRLTAVETLGCTEVVCSDKTGTLTQNKMTVTDEYTVDKILLAKAMALCSDARLDLSFNAVGEPTECALVNYAYKLNVNKTELEKEFPRIDEVPFDSMRKMMTTIHQNNGKITQYTKGAPDELLRKCTYYLAEDGIHELNDKTRSDILAQNKKFADRALRVLAAAYRDINEVAQKSTPEEYEHDLIFIGLCGMIDPVRPEVFEAIKSCKTAGIRPIMITGDHKDTAIAIAMELGIINNPSQAITGAELNDLSDEDFDQAIDYFSVYARVQPEHKVRIVKAWKKKGKITAMTGDGVNDAPSIKTSDIGIGMGITGTDVTKNVADMILGDDNFATIVYAVEEGRKIYANIRKAIQFLLSSNLSEVIAIFTATIFGFIILEPVHLLWINLITDSFPALALGMEPGEKDIMKQKPRSSKEGIFAGGIGFDMVYQGLLVGALTLIAYFIGEYFGNNHVWGFVPIGVDGSKYGITMAFLTMSMAEIFHSYNMRSQRKSIFKLKTHNKYLFAAMLASFVLTTAVIYVPFLSNLFGFEEIPFFPEYIIAIGLALSIIPMVELVKLLQRAISKCKKAK